jgi:hypothetical protein
MFNVCSISYSAKVNKIFEFFPRTLKNRDSSVGIATGYGLEDQGVGVRDPVGVRIFTSPSGPDRLWGPLHLLSNGYLGLFPRGLSVRGVKLTTHLQLVPMSRKSGSIYPLPHTPSWRSYYLVKHRDNFTLPMNGATVTHRRWL